MFELVQLVVQVPMATNTTFARYSRIKSFMKSEHCWTTVNRLIVLVEIL